MIIKFRVSDCLVYEKDLMDGFIKKFGKLVRTSDNFMVANALDSDTLPPLELLHEVEKTIRRELRRFVANAFISYDKPNLEEWEQKDFLEKIQIEFLEYIWEKDEGKSSWYWFTHAEMFIVL